jgi:hypothetical protein
MPIDKNINKLERSYGGNVDFNYRTAFGEKVTFSINQLFFYTYLDNPLLLQTIKQTAYTNLSIRQGILIQEERKPISKSAMKILNCFWAIRLQIHACIKTEFRQIRHLRQSTG